MIPRFAFVAKEHSKHAHFCKGASRETLLAQEEEIQQLIAGFQAQDLQGNAVAQ
ncbi:MAG: hypothetical protein JWR26_1280 [Pedosphaera sp.]|nr:hypothetical protein [Pedosphaera sp.]